MASVVIIYASMSGNTEEMADEIAKGVREGGIEPVQKSVMDATASELLQYDGLLLGAYTWGDGDLPDEFLDFFDEMNEVDLHDRKAAVFGSADSSYALYGEAVHILIHKLEERGALNVLEGLKIELSPSAQEREECRDFGKKFARMLLNDA